MTSRRILAGLAAWGLGALCGCGGGSVTKGPYLGPGYTFDRMKVVMLAVAPAPVTGEFADRVDIAFEYIFNDTPGSQLRDRPATVRQRMSTDRDLVLTLNRIVDQKYGPSELQRWPSLLGLLTQKQIEDLRTKLLDSDMLLMPEDFVLHPEASRTTGSTTFRVYDLHTGKLLLRDSVSQTVPVGGPTGQRKAMIELVIGTQRQFARYLLPPE
jgi:hypothetical protein